MPRESEKKGRFIMAETNSKAAAIARAKKTQNSNSERPSPVTPQDKGTALTKRVIAIIFWVLAFACEMVAIMNLSGKWYLPDLIHKLPDNYLLYLIIFLVLDVIFVAIGSKFWKDSNHYDPASRENKLKFFLQNQLGFIVAIACFVPFIIILLTKKDIKLDKKDKTIVTVVAVIALLIAGLLSWDFNPVSKEDLESAVGMDQDVVYVTQYGHCFHLSKDCQSLANSGVILEINCYGFVGDEVDENAEPAETAAKKAVNMGYRLCKFCEKDLEALENGEKSSDETDLEEKVSDIIDNAETDISDKTE